jgi:predicted metal-dependent enzyme (double-stranded beta helix superfamily)
LIAGLDRLAQAMGGDDEFVAAMQRFAQRFETYRDRLPMIPYAYTRTRLAVAPHYEVVVMRWSPGSISPIHDHGSSHCWVLMLEGSLDVENFERESANGSLNVTLRPAGRITLGPGDVDHRGGPTELHRVRNASDEMAYSLQLYSEPIGRYTVVDARAGHSRIVTATCDLELLE